MTQKQKKGKHLPDFGEMTKEEEAHWWETHDTADYLGELREVQVEFSPEALQPPPKQTKGLHVRLDPISLGTLRAAARIKGLGTTSLARMWILERLQQVIENPKTAKV